ncbi:MAG: hypothetical protein ACOCXS_01375 [Bacteroidota bacterium]
MKKAVLSFLKSVGLNKVLHLKSVVRPNIFGIRGIPLFWLLPAVISKIMPQSLSKVLFRIIIFSALHVISWSLSGRPERPSD